MTSEYVSLGHPDKTADYISEYILDKYLERDRGTRYAVEVQLKDNFVSLAGEVSSTANFTEDELKAFTREAVEDVGYTHEYASRWPEGATLDASKLDIAIHISQQSRDIAQGVDNEGWGDQGIFWGLAVNDPEHDYMPLDHWLAKKIGKHLYENKFGGLDIKTQVTLRNGKPDECIVAIPTIPGTEEACIGSVKNYVKSVLGPDCHVIVNGTGKYVVHSSVGDAGTTGRKLVVDFYGGNCKIGGGSPWTKDPTKADLTLNVYARKIAKEHVIKTGIAECYVALSCCIGRREITVDIYDCRGLLMESYIERKPASEVIADVGLDKAKFTDLCKNGILSGV